jgi:parvulin-like peptidyl-prolyl isomerase
MSKILAAALLVALATPIAAQHANAPLVQDGNITVDTLDFHANLLRVPEERRGDVRTSYDRVASLVDNIFITRSLAERAREQGLDKDPVVQRRIQQAADAVLADQYVSRLDREIAAVDFEQRARELYRADPKRFVTDEHVNIQQILVNLHGRTRAQALERARMIAQKARAGEDGFLTLAMQYSDDPEKRGNRGDLGFNSPKSLVEPIRKALDGMKPGQVSEPIESEHGFHIIKFIERRKGEQLSFEAVREQIINAERARLQKQRIDQVVMQVRSSPTTVIHRENVEALVIPVPPEVAAGKVREQASKK